MSKEIMIYACFNNREHVHMLIGVPPQVSVLRTVLYMKGSVHQVINFAVDFTH